MKKLFTKNEVLIIRHTGSAAVLPLSRTQEHSEHVSVRREKGAGLPRPNLLKAKGRMFMARSRADSGEHRLERKWRVFSIWRSGEVAACFFEFWPGSAGQITAGQAGWTQSDTNCRWPIRRFVSSSHTRKAEPICSLTDAPRDPWALDRVKLDGEKQR